MSNDNEADRARFHELRGWIESTYCRKFDEFFETWRRSGSQQGEDLTAEIYQWMCDHIYDPPTPAVEQLVSYGRQTTNAYYAIACMITEDYLGTLEVNGNSCQCLLNYIENNDSFHIYHNLIEHYSPYLNFSEYQHVLERADKIFRSDAVAHLKELFRHNTSDNVNPPLCLLLENLVHKEQKVSSGLLIRTNREVWERLIRAFGRDWAIAYQVPPEKWEEIIAAALDAASYDRVTLTPRSGDLGRDVIAEKHGFGAVKVAVSVKAYSKDRIVPYDDIRALVGVLGMDTSLSKGMITTLSDFPPRIMRDPLLAPLIPFRLELVDGNQLRQWLRSFDASLTKEP